jgi:hypothetical protein
VLAHFCIPFGIRLTYDPSVMSMIDPQKERQRLAQVYANLTNEELADLAVTGDTLTDIARETLRAEISSRKLDLQVSDPPPTPDHSKKSDLVVIHQFRDLPEALIAKGGLESAGIESFLEDDNLVRLDWFVSNLIGGVKLLVKKEDADGALEILEQGVPETIDLDELGEYKQPSCPKCHSLDVIFGQLDKPVAYLSTALLNVPVVVHSHRWKCNSCRHEWESDTSQE